jgi:hypothetical protein
MKRIRNADASIVELAVVCPYKQCGLLLHLEHAQKGEVIECNNCRKPIKIRKVV